MAIPRLLSFPFRIIYIALNMANGLRVFSNAKAPRVAGHCGSALQRAGRLFYFLTDFFCNGRGH